MLCESNLNITQNHKYEYQNIDNHDQIEVLSEALSVSYRIYMTEKVLSTCVSIAAVISSAFVCTEEGHALVQKLHSVV